MMITQIAALMVSFFSQNLSIEEFRFVWTVSKIEKTSLEVMKDQEKTVVVVRKNFEAIYLTAPEAIAIGQALGETEKKAEALKGKDGSETVETKNHKISFNQTPKAGFFVSIRQKDGFGQSLLIDRKPAIAFAKDLQRADKLIQLVDEKIRP